MISPFRSSTPSFERSLPLYPLGQGNSGRQAGGENVVWQERPWQPEAASGHDQLSSEEPFRVAFICPAFHPAQSGKPAKRFLVEPVL